MIIRNGIEIAKTINVVKQTGGSDINLLEEFANFLLDDYKIQQLYNGNYIINEKEENNENI